MAMNSELTRFAAEIKTLVERNGVEVVAEELGVTIARVNKWTVRPEDRGLTHIVIREKLRARGVEPPKIEGGGVCSRNLRAGGHRGLCRLADGSEELKAFDELTLDYLLSKRPRRRSECPPIDASGKRSCPWMGCRYHLGLYIRNRTSVVVRETPMDCALDAAELGGMTLAEVAHNMGGITRERIRQIEVAALRKLEAGAAVLSEHLDAERPPIASAYNAYRAQ